MHGYLHDRLGKVPRAPVAEPRLHRGRDETFVSGSIIWVVGGLWGVWKREEKTETELVMSTPTLSVSLRQSLSGDQGIGVNGQVSEDSISMVPLLLCPGDQGTLTVKTGL